MIDSWRMSGVALLILLASGLVLIYFLRASESDSSAERGFETLIEEANRPFDLGLLADLRSFGKQPPDQALAHGWVLLMNIPSLGCNTCVNRDLQYLAEMHRKHGESLGFILLAHEYHRADLRNLRRVARVEFPILLDSDQKLVHHFDERLTVWLIDREFGRVVLEYYPSPDPRYSQAVAFFEKRALEVIAEHHPAK